MAISPSISRSTGSDSRFSDGKTVFVVKFDPRAYGLSRLVVKKYNPRELQQNRNVNYCQY